MVNKENTMGEWLALLAALICGSGITLWYEHDPVGIFTFISGWIALLIIKTYDIPQN